MARFPEVVFTYRIVFSEEICGRGEQGRGWKRNINHSQTSSEWEEWLLRAALCKTIGAGGGAAPCCWLSFADIEIGHKF